MTINDHTDALRVARALSDYLTGVYEDVPGDDSAADRHLDLSARRAKHLVASLERWNRRIVRLQKGRAR